MSFFFILFIIALTLFILFLQTKKESLKLIEHFQGRLRAPLGTKEIYYRNFLFRISKISSGRGASGIGGSYSELWTYVGDCKKTLIGNEKSGAYSSGRFLILPPHEVIVNKGTPLLLASETKETLLELKTHFESEKESIQSTLALFPDPFSQFTLSDEAHLGGPFLIQKKKVLRYRCLPHEIYSEPEKLEVILDQILKLCQLLQIQIEPS